jgi:hypothetical protein
MDAKANVIHLDKFVLTENIVYLMGTSFILGSLFTIFTLLVLDFMRRDKVK